MTRRSPLLHGASLLALLALVAGCSGGGGNSPAPAPTAMILPTPSPSPRSGPTASPSAAPLPTVTFTPRVSASGVVASIYTIQSVPAGLAVSANATPLGLTQPSGSPQLAYAPNFSNKLTAITIAPSDGASPFTFGAAQTANGNHTVLYNQLADTNGSIGSISATALGRRLANANLSGARPRRFGPFHARGKPAFSTTRLAVHYRTALLAKSGLRASDLEAGAGVVRATGIGFERNGEITRILEVPKGQTIAALAATMRARPEVAAAEPLGLRYLASSTAVLPNDTHFDDVQQWDMFDIAAPDAWGYTEGNPLLALGGSGISIAVIDTGLDNHHPDLAGKVIYGESVIDGVVTYGAAAAQDSDGHGTNVSGIAAADTNNGYGFAGTAFNTTLTIYKVFADGSPSSNTGDIAQALYDAVANGARVVNLSLASAPGTEFDPVERDAVEYAIAHGVVVVAAAGNDSTTQLGWPAGYDGVIAVGATSLNDSANPGVPAGAIEYVASYSDTGPNLGVVAPGGDPSSADLASTGPPDYLHWIYNIFTTTPIDPANFECAVIADCAALYAGTSQAAPHVTGTVALMLALNPGLTPAQVRSILESSSDDISDPNQGHGRLDAYRALAAVKGDSTGLALPGNLNFVAFAYVPNGTNLPAILDVTYPFGVPVASAGTFRIADVPASAPAYKIGVWADVNGDGKVDAGDYFGTSGSCSANAPCAGAAGIVVHPVASGFTLQ